MSDDIADLLVAEAETVVLRDDASMLAAVRDLHYVPGPDPERPWRSGRAEYEVTSTSMASASVVSRPRTASP